MREGEIGSLFFGSLILLGIFYYCRCVFFRRSRFLGYFIFGGA